MNPTLVFRADGSSNIGYGHIHRLISLAFMLHSNFNCLFVSDDAPDFLTTALQQLAISFIQVPNNQYPFPNERKTQASIAFDMEDILTGNEIVVLDGYWFGKAYQQAIKAKGCTLVYIDDLIEQGNIADVVINHAPGLSNTAYTDTALSTCMYTGTKFCLSPVPTTFLHQSKAGFKKQLLIAMGGADPLNFTQHIIEQEKDLLNAFEKVVVLIGNGYLHETTLSAAIASIPTIELKKNLSKNAVYELMQTADTAILSASTMAVEYAQIGGLLAILQTAENQQNIYQGLLSSSAAITIEGLKNSNAETYQQCTEAQQQMFDGKTSERFNKLFTELTIQSIVQIEKATAAHTNITYQWATNSIVRAHSFSTHTISLAEHEQWFSKKIADPQCLYFIGKWNDTYIGSIRFDFEGDTACISYLVDPALHGKGMGRILLAKGLAFLSTQIAIHTVVGYVMPQNLASVKVFERFNFNCTTEANKLKFTKKNYR
ncbi:MAG: GNAT family N-acetyltransferase [Ferruginibacter sp.]